MADHEPPHASPDPGLLRVRKKRDPEQEKLREAEKSASHAVIAREATRKTKRKKKRRHSSRMRFLGLSLGPCLLGLAVLGTFLAHQVLAWEILTPEQALLTRNIAMAAFLAVIVLEAFSEDLMQGVLCFFVLPYSFVYALFFSDAGPLRGLTVAVLVFLGAEMALTPEEALVPRIQATLNEWIHTGQEKLIDPDGRPDAGFDR